MSLKGVASRIKKEQKKANSSLAEQFIAALDNYLVTSRTEEDKQRSSSIAFKPSSYYKCGRAVYYSLKGFPQKEKKYPRSVRILEMGTFIHQWVQEQVIMRFNEQENSPVKLIPVEELPSFGKAGVVFIEHASPLMEVKFKDYRFTKEIPISAMIDGAIEFNNFSFVFEFKTINQEDYNTLIEPTKEHVKQGALYALSTGINSVMFVYYSKNKQDWKAFQVDYTKEQLDWVKKRLVDLEESVLTNSPPPKEPSDQCRWCGHKELCQAEA